MNFGRIIKILRRHHGLTQIELSQKSGVSQGFISKVERDLQELTLEAMINIFYVFNNVGKSSKGRKR